MVEAFYREYIVDHYRNPRNFGRLRKPDYSWKEYNALCGDMILIQLRVEKEKPDQRISQVKFLGSGCAICLASASLLTERIQKLTLREALLIDKEDILKMLGIDLSPARLKCALLPLVALKKALGRKSDQNE